MILRSIVVQGWRCFANPVSVGPFTEGLNVLHASNAAGKSTLFEAMRLGLLDGIALLVVMWRTCAHGDVHWHQP